MLRSDWRVCGPEVRSGKGPGHSGGHSDGGPDSRLPCAPAGGPEAPPQHPEIRGISPCTEGVGVTVAVTEMPSCTDCDMFRDVQSQRSGGLCSSGSRCKIIVAWFVIS